MDFSDEKLPTSPTLCSSPTSPVDLESQKPIRTATWSSRLGVGKEAKQFRDRKREVREFINDTDTRSLDDSAKGYPQLGCFLSSESSFSLYRGFSYLHSRVLLQLQDELAYLEKELDELDEADKEDDRKLNLQSRRADEDEPRDEDDGYRPRKEILNDIHKKLLEYDEVVMKSRDMLAMGRPSDRDYGSVRTWFWNEKPLADEKEAQFIKKKEDIISLRHGREWSAFDAFVENTLIWLTRHTKSTWLRQICCTPEMRAKTNSRYLNYLSPSRVEKLIGIIITAVVFVLLVAPVVLMYCLTSNHHNDPKAMFRAIGVLIVFTLLFSGAMSMLTKAKRHELFAAAAAYCAILVVFISNFQN